MGRYPLGESHEQPKTHSLRVARAGRWLGETFRQTREQLAAADLNPSEGKLRSSVAPAEYLPSIPDHPPVHDNTL